MPDPHATPAVGVIEPRRIPMRQPLHPDITEEMIELLVRDFYGRVRQDPDLGPIFARVITDWEPHLQTMMAFWSSITLMSGRYKGQAMQKHQALVDVEPGHFDRWLALFRDSAREVTPPGVADVFIARSELIAETLKRGMFGPPA